MKKILGLCGAALLFAAGCQTPDEGKKTGDVKKVELVEQDDQTLRTGRALADQYMACFVPAVKQNDFSLLQSALPAKLSERDQRTYFSDQMKWITEKLGVLKEEKFLDVFRKGALCEYVWKLTFEKISDGKTTQVDLPYVVRTVCEPAGKVKILMVGFVIR